MPSWKKWIKLLKEQSKMKVELYNQVGTVNRVKAIQNLLDSADGGRTNWPAMYGFLYQQPCSVVSHNLTPEGVLVLTMTYHYGDLVVQVNDWLVKDAAGKFCVRSSKVFEQKYKLVQSKMANQFIPGDKVAGINPDVGIPEEGGIVKHITDDTTVYVDHIGGGGIGTRLVDQLTLLERLPIILTKKSSGLKALAVSAEKNKALYNFDKPDPNILETFPTPEGCAQLEIRATIPEFTSLCPITSQPDWATIIIDYVPDKLCVESKSLKLYKEGFRNFGEFHEACCQRICTDLVKLLDPVQLRVIGNFRPRGGISIHPIAEYPKPKENEDGGAEKS